MQSADWFQFHQRLIVSTMDAFVWEDQRRGYIVHLSMIGKDFEFFSSMNQVDKWDEN
jgi:hypothetical protein